MANILIIDRDQQSAGKVAEGLQGAGHSCAVRRTGKEALTFAKSQPLDLMVIDAMLPDVSGFEVCRQIRQDSELYTLPIIFLSAMNNPEEIEHGLDQGADDYLTKPYEMDQLVQRIDGVLRSSFEADHIDHLTDLPDSEATRKRIHQFITRGNPFSLVYIELLNLRQFAVSTGDKGRDRALRHVARALKIFGEDFHEGDFFVGHLGGGYFICALPADRVEKYCDKVQNGWRKHVESLYQAADIGGLFEAAEGGSQDVPPILDLLFCITTCDGSDPVSAQQLMDTVSRIRRTLGEMTTGGVHLDRRR